MQGYKLMADSYRKIIELRPEDPNRGDFEKDVKMYDFLGECTEEDIYRLYNSGAFNDITKGYCRKAMKESGIDDKKIAEVMEHLRWLHDTIAAQDIK